MRGILARGQRLVLRMILRRTTPAVVGQCPLQDVANRRAVLMRVEADDPARLQLEHPQPKLPPLHSLEFATEIEGYCLLRCQSPVVRWRRLLAYGRAE